MTHTHVKDQGRRTLGSKDRVESYGRTDGQYRADCITLLANAVRKKIVSSVGLRRTVFAKMCTFLFVSVRTKTLLSESLKETLVDAAYDSRLITGLNGCGQLLQR